MDRITMDRRVRWGTPCVRDTGITVAYVVALDRAGLTLDRILDSCPELTTADVDDALAWFGCWGPDGLGPQPPDPGHEHPHVEVDPDIQGGYPVITGTRITVDAVLGLWEEGCAIDEILDELPGLTAEDVADAVAYDLDARR